jgi:hypothetical protein
VFVGVESAPAVGAAAVVAGVAVVAAGFEAFVLLAVPAPFVLVAGLLQADAKVSVAMASVMPSAALCRIFIFISSDMILNR